MPIVKLPVRWPDPLPLSWQAGGGDVEGAVRLDDYPAAVADLREQGAALRAFPVGDLVHFFDSLADEWLTRRADELRALAPYGLAFILPFLKADNLGRLLAGALRGAPEYLDGFRTMRELGRRVMAHPRGVVTHWLAGNVPALGFLSIVQAVLSKNASVVKVPSENGRLLPALWAWVGAHVAERGGRTVVPGPAVAASALFVSCDPQDGDGQRALSLESDVRVAWGGRDAVDAILRLPKRPGTEDVVCGPRTSLAVIGRESVAADGVDRVADALAFDASIHDQRGCHSPHTVFVERGGAVSPDDFAQALAAAMERALARVPKPAVSAADAFAVAAVRAEWELKGTVRASSGTAWTVVYSETAGLGPPCGCRVVFVRPIDDVKDVIAFLGPGHQAIGLQLDTEREVEFARRATARGVDRITRLGRMGLYDYPWDGVFPIDRFVRWVSLD